MNFPDIESHIRAYVPEAWQDGVQPIFAAVKTIAYSSLSLIALHKYTSWTEKSIKLLSLGGLEIMQSVKTGGMLGLATIIDSVIGIIIRKLFENREKHGTGWIFDKLGIRYATQVPQWQSHQDLPIEKKAVEAKPQLEIPHWIRITQRAAALGITCLAFTAILGPQPLLYACAVSDLTWFVFQGVLADFSAPCKYTGALYILGGAIMCASPEIYLGCAAVVIISYLVYKVVEHKFYTGKYYAVDKGIKTGDPVKLSDLQARHYAIGIHKINRNADMEFHGEDAKHTIKDTGPSSNRSLKAALKQCQEEKANVETSRLFPRQETLQNDIQAADSELKAHSLVALFYRKLDWEQSKQTLIANLTQQIQTLEKKDLEALLTSRLEGLATSQLNHLSDNKKAFLSTAKENLLARVILSHAKQLLSELEKAADDAEFQKVKATYIAKAEKNNRFLLYYLRWSKASANLKLIPDKRTRLEAIKQFLEAKEELLKLKIAELPKTRPGRKNRVYWSALLNGEEVILREDQLQFIPAGNRSEALKRQKAAVKATAITGFFGKATESFLTGATSINPADLISISNPIIDNLSQFGMPVVMGGMELTKLLPDDDARFASLKKMGAQAEDPTGNGVKDLTPKDRALLSSQIVHCAQIIHHYKSYYDMKTFTIPRDRTVKGDKPAMASTVPLFEKNKKGEPLAGKFITDQYGKPVLGLVCEALIDELGIRGANAQEKHANLEMVVTHTLGESLEQRARRKANKKIALAKAKTETQKTKVQRKFKTPQNETKYILGNLKYKMDLITPLTVYERKNEQRQPITSRVSFTPISEAEGKELSAKVENPIPIFSEIGAHRSLIKHQLAELDLAC